MTQNEKDILLKDLCARLPYKVKVQDTYYNSLEPAPIWLLDLDAQVLDFLLMKAIKVLSILNHTSFRFQV